MQGNPQNRALLQSRAREKIKAQPFEQVLSFSEIYLGTDNPYLNPISPSFPEFINSIRTVVGHSTHWVTFS